MGADDKLFEKFGRTFPAGTVLCREGETGDEMYIIQSGQVKITKGLGNLEKTLTVLPAGEFFGEMSILNKLPRSATATVIEDAKVLVIDTKTFETMIRNNAEIALRIIRKLAARLQETNNQIESLLFKDSNQRVVHTLLRWVDTRGKTEGNTVQIEATPQELAAAAGLEENQFASVWEEVGKAGVVQKAEKGYVISNLEKLKKYFEYLTMKEQFGG